MPYRSEKISELFDAETRLPDDRTECSGFEVTVSVDGNDDRTRRGSRKYEHVMASRDPLNHESRSEECLHDALSRNDREPRTHIRLRRSRGELREERLKGWGSRDPVGMRE